MSHGWASLWRMRWDVPAALLRAESRALWVGGDVTCATLGDVKLERKKMNHRSHAVRTVHSLPGPPAPARPQGPASEAPRQTRPQAQPHAVWQSGQLDFCDEENHLYRQAAWNLLWQVRQESFGSWRVVPCTMA